MSWKKVKLKQVLKQYKNTHWIDNNKKYRQVTISQTGEVSFRGEKHGLKIGRKRQFLIDLKNHPKTLIFIRQGVMKGGIGVCPPEVDECVVTENMPMFEIKEINPDYLLNFIKSPLFKEEVSKLVPIGTAQKALHENKLLEIEIPCPSEKEQQEIVQKIQSIEKEIKQLENNITKDKTLLTTLKQSILQEAVQGKLVPQNKEDEPASELLKKIKTEKEKLIREGKIKKQKPLPPIADDEIPYDLPRGWAWCRLGEIAQHNTGKTLDKGRNKGKLRNYITTSNLYWKYFDLSNLKKIPIPENELDRFSAIKGDLLIIEGGDAGRAAIWNKDYNICFQNHIHRVRPYVNISSEYLLKFFEKINLSGEINKYRKGVGISSISGKALASIIIPLPPLPEQQRIVEKVDKLMALCGELEERIKQNKKHSQALMGAVLGESFENEQRSLSA